MQIQIKKFLDLLWVLLFHPVKAWCTNTCQFNKNPRPSSKSVDKLLGWMDVLLTEPAWKMVTLDRGLHNHPTFTVDLAWCEGGHKVLVWKSNIWCQHGVQSCLDQECTWPGVVKTGSSWPSEGQGIEGVSVNGLPGH